MTRKKVKLSWVIDESSRSLSLKKRKLGLVKKVRELTILCDVDACMIIYSPNEVEPMIWPSIEAARDLLGCFFSLPEIEQKKKETNLESYLKEKTKKVYEQVKKSHKKNTEYVVDQLMMQLLHGRRIVDLTLKEVYELLSFSRDKIMFWRKKIESVQHLPLRDPPMNIMLLDAQSEELRTIMNNVFQKTGLRDDERADQAGERINIGGVRDNQSRYLMDEWLFTSSEPPALRTSQQIGLNANLRSYLPYQGSSSHGNPNLEMVPVDHQILPFHGLVGSSSQLLHHDHSMNIDPRLAVMNTQPKQYPFAFMSHDGKVNEERDNNMNNGNPQLHRSNNTVTNNDGLGQEQPPNGPVPEEDNNDATSFDINKVLPGVNNNHI